MLARQIRTRVGYSKPEISILMPGNQQAAIALPDGRGERVSASSPVPNESQAVFDRSIEISVKGEWVTVPALHFHGINIVAKGRWIRVATVHDEEWLETELQNPQECIKSLKEQESHKLRADIFTFSQKPSSTVPRYAYPMEPDSVAAAHFTSFNAWWEKLPQETRKNVRRSQKRGVVTEVRKFDAGLLKAISEVNNDSPMRQRERNIYYRRSLEQVRKDYGSFVDRSDFICASVGPEIVGFLKLVYRGEVASILNFTPKASHSDKRPANALIAKAVELCAAKGISYLTYGKYNYGNKGDSPLRQFKIRNGFEEILVPRFYAPLTNWGRICVSLKLHRGLLGLLPHHLISAAIAAREKWHDFKQPKSRCSSMPERPNRNRQMECSNPPAGSNI